MNLQRREEIREISASLRMMPPNEAAGAIDELLAHIDTLEQTAAERVIADGSRGPTPDYTGEGSAWVPPVETPAVVVPEIMLSDISNECGAMLCDDREAFRRGALWAQKFITSRLRAIPADRVLGEGMLSIHPDVLNSISDTLREIGDTAHNASTGPAVPDVLWEIRGKAYEAYIVATDAEAEIVQTANAQDALSALRASQGGAAT